MKRVINLLIPILLLGLAMFVLAESARIQPRAGYGEACNTTRRCSKRDWLTCNSSEVCGCLNNEVMTYEVQASNGSLTETGKCGTRVQERCKYSVGSDADGGALYDTLPCVQNAECDSEGFCVCNPGFYENSNATCTAFRAYAQKCSSELKCEAEFDCVNSECRCNPLVSAYNSRTSKCVGLVGQPCLNGTCVANANVQCSSNVCTCNSGYFKSNQNICSLQLSFGSRCARDEECGKDSTTSTRLKCVEGKCNCDSAVSMYGSVKRSDGRNHASSSSSYYGYYSSSSTYRFCAPKARQRCHSGLCAPNAYCKYDSSSYSDSYGDGTCDCIPGTTTHNSTGVCMKAYNTSCSTSNECTDDLVCKEPGKCYCKYNEQTYNPSNKVCESKVNGPCTSDFHCRTSAECRMVDGASVGHCACKAGFISNGAQGCKGAFNATCALSSSGYCASLRGLQCIESRCNCTKFSIYSEKYKKCVGLVGAGCKVGAEGGCLANAYCAYTEDTRYLEGDATNPISGMCTCSPGFTITDDYHCQPVDEEINEILDNSLQTSTANTSANSVFAL